MGVYITFENEDARLGPLINKMSSCSSGSCCTVHVRCCFCVTGQVDDWPKSLRNVPKVIPVTWAEWLENSGKKTTGDKSYKFFRESYVHDIYTGYAKLNDTALKKAVIKARCYRSLKKNEEPHYYLVVQRQTLLSTLK